VRFDDLEKIAFEKDAGWFTTPLSLASKLGKPAGNLIGAGVEGVGAGLGKLWNAAGPLRGAANMVGSAINYGALGTAKALSIPLRAGAGLAIGGLASGANMAIRGGVLPAGRMLARQFGRAPVNTSLGLIGAYGSAQNIGHVLSGDAYHAARSSPYISTAPSAFGTAKYNPFNKLSEEAMPLRMHDLEKIAEGGSLTTKGTVTNMLTEKLLFPMITQMAAPVLQMIGHRAAAKMFSPQALAHAEEIHGKALAEYEGKEQVKKLEAQKKERDVRPKMYDVFENLRKQDDVIAEAYKDPHLKNMMHQTMETVYAFAPDVAKDHRTMQSVIRNALTTGPNGGLDFQTAKQLAETQKFISESRGGKK